MEFFITGTVRNKSRGTERTAGTECSSTRIILTSLPAGALSSGTAVTSYTGVAADYLTRQAAWWTAGRRTGWTRTATAWTTGTWWRAWWTRCSSTRIILTSLSASTLSSSTTITSYTSTVTEDLTLRTRAGISLTSLSTSALSSSTAITGYTSTVA